MRFTRLWLAGRGRLGRIAFSVARLAGLLLGRIFSWFRLVGIPFSRLGVFVIFLTVLIRRVLLLVAFLLGRFLIGFLLVVFFYVAVVLVRLFAVPLFPSEGCFFSSEG